jgi:hypothetical protein
MTVKTLFTHKKFSRYIPIILLLLLTTIFLLPLAKGTFYVTHDGQAHLERAAAHAKAFQIGHIPPRWAWDLNFGYGSPMFVVFYPFAEYLTVLFHTAGLSLEHAYMLLAAVTFLIGPIGFYFWIEKLFGSRRVAFVGAIFYALMPYRFLMLYVRGGTGEMLAFALLPFILYFIELKGKYSFLIGGIVYGIFVLSHNGLSVMFSPVIAAYGLLRYYRLKTFFILLIGLGLSSYFWIPSLLESRYMSFYVLFGDMYKEHFQSFLRIIYSPWGFGDDVNKAGGQSPQLGIPSIVVVLASGYLLLRQEKQHWSTFTLFWLLILICGVFLSLPVSTVFWEQITILKRFQFPWRFLAIAAFSSAVLFAVVISKIKREAAFAIIVLGIVMYAIPYVKVREYRSQSDAVYYTHQGTTTYRAESTPLWTAGDATNPAKKQIEIVGGRGSVKRVSNMPLKHLAVVDAREAVTIVDNTLYYPGWKATIDGSEVPIQFQDPNHRGLITFQVPQGQHNIAVEFTETRLRLMANAITLFTAAILMFIAGMLFIRLHKKGKKAQRNILPKR